MAPGFDSLDVCTVRCECVSTTNTGCNSMPGRRSRPSDERRCVASQRSTRPHQLRLRAHFAVLTQSAWLAWGNARFVDDGTSPNLPQRHYRRQETTPQRRRFRCHRQPRLMIACAELLHTGIRKPLPYVPAPVCVSVMRGCVLLSALPSPIWMLARVPASGINASIGWIQN